MEKGEFDDKEAFVTSAYKKKLEERAEEEEREKKAAALEGEGGRGQVAAVTAGLCPVLVVQAGLSLYVTVTPAGLFIQSLCYYCKL